MTPASSRRVTPSRTAGADMAPPASELGPTQAGIVSQGREDPTVYLVEERLSTLNARSGHRRAGHRRFAALPFTWPWLSIIAPSTMEP